MLDLLGMHIYWLWLIVGLILLTFEIIIPGVYLFWFGLAAGITGLCLALFAPLFSFLELWQTQLCLFLVFSVLAVAIARHYFSKEKASDNPFLNQTVAALIGRSFIITRPIENDISSVEINGTIWRIRGKNLHLNQKVKILAYKQGYFEVE